MPKIFDSVRSSRPKMSAFDLSREQKLSCNFGELIPTYLEEIVPGDQFRVNTECMVRLAPMIAPVMHRVNVFMHYFYVPNRLIWSQWEDFITGGEDGTTKPTMPIMPANFPATQAKTRLADYLGLPTVPNTDTAAAEISELPFRAYQLIWNEYYRDQNLEDEVDIFSQSAVVEMQRRAFEKDYFTSALPFPQRGPEVGIPIDYNYKDTSEVYRTSDGAAPPGGREIATHSAQAGQLTYEDGGTWTNKVRIENLEDESISASINELRKSNALQRWLEKSARGGSRYIETILNHFGVKSSDARLQRPEYLGGGKQPITISEVLNTTGTTDAPQGAMSGHGISVGQTNTFQSQFEEHGFVMGILSVLPRTSYQQGISRMWSRTEKEDYYWPEFAHLGEQEVKNKEVYHDGDSTTGGDAWNEGTFGYQQRYAEYKYAPSTVHGDFRNNLDFWHMGRIFNSQPSLNKDFVKYPSATAGNPPDERVFAVQDGTDKLWIQMYHDVKARRPMPYFADPRL